MFRRATRVDRYSWPTYLLQAEPVPHPDDQTGNFIIFKLQTARRRFRLRFRIQGDPLADRKMPTAPQLYMLRGGRAPFGSLATRYSWAGALLQGCRIRTARTATFSWSGLQVTITAGNSGQGREELLIVWLTSCSRLCRSVNQRRTERIRRGQHDRPLPRAAPAPGVPTGHARIGTAAAHYSWTTVLLQAQPVPHPDDQDRASDL
ncbi:MULTISPECIES: hypothetical protein [Paenibacillus]|uniref:hypothetical protein n=1 Tax=Paenibacillus TaxID=44249 RepID=UPI001BCBB90F|nr:hypothetical protein [Paenibacillus dendritiformis]